MIVYDLSTFLKKCYAKYYSYFTMVNGFIAKNITHHLCLVHCRPLQFFSALFEIFSSCLHTCPGTQIVPVLSHGHSFECRQFSLSWCHGCLCTLQPGHETGWYWNKNGCAFEFLLQSGEEEWTEQIHSLSSIRHRSGNHWFQSDLKAGCIVLFCFV